LGDRHRGRGSFFFRLERHGLMKKKGAGWRIVAVGMAMGKVALLAYSMMIALADFPRSGLG
jgi:hypothetical protein